MNRDALTNQVLDLLRSSEDIVVCGHVSPDGDCLGSALGLAWALRSLGKEVTCLLAASDPLDAGLEFLPGIDGCIPASDYEGAPDLFVAVDVPNADRMGEAACAIHARAPRTLTIDHHLTDKPFSDLNLIDSDAPAASMIVWDVVCALGCVDERVATCCYTGLVTDTGRFQYQNTSPSAFTAACAMVQAGADPAVVAREVYQSRSRQSLALEQRMLGQLSFVGDGQFAVGYVTRSDFVETGAEKTDAEPLMDVLRSLKGVRVACMLRQNPDNVRGSLRAKDDTDVAEIAGLFGGGGHKAAAGFTFTGSLDEARERVEDVFRSLAK